jgi:hypothetical protein
MTSIFGLQMLPLQLLARSACLLVAHRRTPQCPQTKKHRRHSSCRDAIKSCAIPSLSAVWSGSGAVKQDMATQQDEGGVPFSIAHQQQHFRLLELPPEIVELIDAPNPPL